jgi:dihydrolipoamide dehydrogenase
MAHKLLCHDRVPPTHEQWQRTTACAARALPKSPTINDTIQPFPTFSEINIAALKALRVEIAAMPNLVAAWP